MRAFIIQSKDGTGKSYFTKLLTLRADKEKALTYFIDADNASASTTKFFKGIEDRKSPHVLFKSENLLGSDKKIDRTKFDTFVAMVGKLDDVVVDFGAASSEQLLYYMQEELKNDILQTLKDMGIRFYLLVAGGGSIKESIEFALALSRITGIEHLVTVVANEYQGGVKGETVMQYSNAHVQLKTLHEDPNSEAQREWNELLSNGLVYSDIESMSIIRKRRIVAYLDSIFTQLNELSYEA
jgi:hypothetical protein